MGISRVKDVEKKKEKEEKEKKKEKKQGLPFKKEKKSYENIVRLLNTDLDGTKPVINAIRGVTGIGFTFAKAVIEAGGFDPRKKLGDFTEEELNKLEDVIKHPEKYGIPTFLYNRRKDPTIGKDMHLTGMDVKITEKFDIQREINLGTYRGWRHMLGQPVRGQRTRSHFRHGRTVGVVRKSVRIQQQKK